MALFKCKMCGGALEINENITVAECEYCGSKQTVPSADNEKKISLFTRANKLRAACEFDKAAGVYESIVAEFIEEAEAYWGLILCNYGIEYVDDPKTGKKIPTCHRTSFDSVLDCENFELVMENADAVAKKVYREEAKAIEELRKSIIEVSSKEEPYDIFICYKETDEFGNRTIDSVIAQDVYTELTDKGYRVFFSRITLEDKLGQEYEPYIFAALNSAKVMLAFGTDYEYYNAVWVKNEWSRFLQLIEKGEKKTLIPCYKNIDAYDMPKEFAKLQAQNMGKVGAVQDLLRGIEKIIGKKESVVQVKERVVAGSGDRATVDSLLKRVFMFLEDGDWNSANEYSEKVLDIDPENAQAYLGKLLSELRVRKQESLWDQAEPFDHNNNYQKALRFADATLAETLKSYVSAIKRRDEEKRLAEARKKQEDEYSEALKIYSSAKTVADFKKAESAFLKLSYYKDSRQKAANCSDRWKSLVYEGAIERTKSESLYDLRKAKEEFSLLGDYKDSLIQIDDLNSKIDSLEKQEKIKKKKTTKKIKIASIVTAACVITAIIFAFILNQTVFLPQKYNNALTCFDNGDYDEGYRLLREIIEYKDSREQIELGKLKQVQYYLKEGETSYAKSLLDEIRIDDTIKEEIYQVASTYLKEKKFEYAEILFREIIDYDNPYKDTEKKHEESRYKSDLCNSYHVFFGIEYMSDDYSDMYWHVLERKGDKVLLIASKCIECLPYDTSNEKSVTWENSTIRKWLNDTFYNTVFSDAEKNLIMNTTIDNSSFNQNGTKDKIFLLTYKELLKYYDDYDSFIVQPTSYAEDKGAKSFYSERDHKSRGCSWLLRDDTFVSSSGGHGITYHEAFGIRPALWLDLSKL